MKTRVITAVVLLPILLLIVLVAPKICTTLLFGVMASVAAYELMTAGGVEKTSRICIYTVLIAFYTVIWCGVGIGYTWLLLGILIYWIVLFAEMMHTKMKLPFEEIAICFTAGVVLPMLLGALVRIHSGTLGRFYILISFVLAFLCLFCWFEIWQAQVGTYN